MCLVVDKLPKKEKLICRMTPTINDIIEKGFLNKFTSHHLVHFSKNVTCEGKSFYYYLALINCVATEVRI